MKKESMSLKEGKERAYGRVGREERQRINDTIAL